MGGRRGRCRTSFPTAMVCRGRWTVRVFVVFVFTLAMTSLTSCQHGNPRFVILETDILGSGGSLLVQSGMGEVEILNPNISLPGFQSACQDAASMGVATSGSFEAVCWLTTKNTSDENDAPDFLFLENFDVIACSWNNSEKVVKIPKVSLTQSLENFHFKLDPFGHNIYWSHKTSRGIWATSISTGYTQLLQGIQSVQGVNLVFAIDPLNGYLFGAFQHPNQVNAVKLPNQELLRVDVPSKINGIALDTENRKVYFSRFGQFRVASYKDTLEGKSDLLLSTSRTPFYHNYLQYHHDHLYWLDGDSVSSLYVKNSTSISTVDISLEVIKPRTKQFVFRVFEKAHQHIINPCKNLSCSHLCLPREGYAYQCGCPVGMRLYRGKHCLDISLLYLYNQSVQLQEFGTPRSASPCIHARIGNIGEGNSLFCHIVAKRSTSIVEIDADGEDWIEQGDNCVIRHSLRGGRPETVLCVSEKGALVSASMDFKRSILFVADMESDPTSGTTYRIKGHRSPTPQSGKLIKRSSSAVMGSLAVNADSVKLFWIEDHMKILMSNYQGSDVTHLTTLKTDYSNRILRAYARLLWWNEPANLSGIAAPRVMEYELGTGTTTEVLRGHIGGGDHMDKLYFSRIRRPKPSTPPKCPRCCLDKNGVCFCPDESMRSSENCSILQFVIAVRPPGKEETFMQVYGPTILSLFNYRAPRINVGNSTKSEQFVSSIDIKRVCFTAGTGAVQCINERGLTQPFEIDPDSSLFMLHRSRDILFWNNGEPGCITMKNLPKNAVFHFKCFPTPNIAARALDPGRRIYFWTNKTHTLNYNILGTEVRGGSVTLDDEFGISGIAIDGVVGAVYIFQGTKTKRMYYIDLFNGVEGAEVINNFELYPPLEEMQFIWKVHLENFNDFIERQSKTTKVISQVTVSRANYPNPCENSKCSHFCLPKSPQTLAESNQSECLCPSKFKLDPDNITCSPLSNSTTTLMIVLIVLAFLLIIVILVITIVMHRRRNAQLRKIIRDLLKGNKKEAQLATNESDKAMHQPFPAHYILDSADITIDEEKVLGEGQFGKVMRGTYRSVAVAVKTIKPSFSLNVLNDFAKEIKIMAYIGSHSHIVTFLGAEMGSVSKGIFNAILELSPYGSLQSFLRERSSAPRDHGTFAETSAPSTIPLPTLLSWSYQIASGMDHLFQKKVIHGDLATRNVLVFDKNVVKLSDFGLSRNLYQYATYQKTNLGPLPWKWMAFESLKFYKFSSESDVWAFGVTLWEVFTYAEIPYPQYRWDDDFVNALLNGLRLTRPLIAPEAIYNDIMLPCWELDASKRPKFSQILSMIANLSKDFSASISSDEQMTYENSRAAILANGNHEQVALINCNSMQYQNHYV